MNKIRPGDGVIWDYSTGSTSTVPGSYIISGNSVAYPQVTKVNVAYPVSAVNPSSQKQQAQVPAGWNEFCGICKELIGGTDQDDALDQVEKHKQLEHPEWVMMINVVSAIDELTNKVSALVERLDDFADERDKRNREKQEKELNG